MTCGTFDASTLTHGSHIPFPHMRPALSTALASGIQQAHTIIHQTRDLIPEDQSRLASLLTEIVEPKLAQHLDADVK